ncbi:MAG: amino acid adenylation domain-containing protein, partial [bacterium]|nr:amino acid adenylation domain-containing protein [bacterium]
EALTPERDLSRTPFFQVMFVLQNVPMPRFELPGLTLEPLEVDSGTAKFDLSLNLEEKAEGFSGWLEYSTELFDAPTIGRLLGHYRRLLEGIVADGDRKLSEQPLMSDAERFELVAEWNATARSYPRDVTLDELFERQVERTPDAVALVYEDRALSYRELDRRTEQLADSLRRLGVGIEVVVGVLMERSLELVVSLLGILKAGGAYLPLEPSYPRERLAFMLADARVPVLLSLERLRDRVPAEAARVLWVDSLPTAAAGPAKAAPPGTGADHLAYTIYTSGSTGQPKGSMISHRGIVNRLLWMQEAYGLEPGEGVLQKTPFSFDVSVWEFFWPLIVGARLVVARPGGHQDSRYLAELIAREQVTTLHFVPSMLQVFLDEPQLAGCSSLKRVISSGEALPYELQERFFTRLGAELHNLYGPTEASVDVTFQPCRPNPPQRSVPIGRPIANIRIYLLDRRGDPLPVGLMGELVIAGVGLARGYLGRPDLTADRFVPDPFCREPGGRLYRTGDQARWRPGGAIEYLGRFDHQVKIRGFRIELGEIETALASHPAIREVVVVARREAARSGPRLVAYLVSSEEPPTVVELRNLLKEQLPEYMVPSAFVFLEAMPLSPNGKVDRRALPAPDDSRPELEEAWVAPRTSNEEILAEIWARMLGVEKVGVHDSFFDLGGDSILGIQVVARAQEAGLRLTPRDLFQYKTIAELAAVAVAQPTAEAEQGRVTGQTPLTPIQRWFFECDRPEPHHFNQAVLLEARQPLDPSLLEGALGKLPEHHDALRLRFFRDGTDWRQVHADRDGAPLVRIDLSALSEESAPAAAAAEALQASLDLARGPLWRVALFDRGPREAARLLWVVHHLAVDGVSWRVLLDDLERAYRQLERGEPLVLPPKTSSFKAWAERMEEYARSEALKEELTCWLAEPRERVEPLPVDFPEGVNTVASTRTVAVELGIEETRSLLQEVPAAYHTQINEVLLTALLNTVTPWTGSDSLLVDLEGHGREELDEGTDLSRTVGWFTALYPVLLELGDAWGPGEELMVVKEKLRAVPNGGIGYGLLRYLSEDGEATGRLRRLPPAGVLFNYLGQLDPAFSDSSPWRPVGEPTGSATGSGGLRTHLLEINGGVAEGRLRLRWSYSENLHRRATVEGLAEGFLEALRLLIDHCLSPEAGGYTPTDFPEARLDQEDLDKLFGQIQRKDHIPT